MLGSFSMLLLSSAEFIQNYLFFKKIISGIDLLSEPHMAWVQIKTNIMSVLIWIQNAGKGFQQMTKVAATGS